jgi:steroid delta-isomerase-like uncharacterized protein
MTTTNLNDTLDEWAAGWSTHDIERVILLCTDHCLYEDVPLGVISHGKDELRAFGAQVFDAFPDIAIELTTRFTAADSAMLEWTMSGTHHGTLAGMPPTGASFSVRGATALQLERGLISRNSDYWDMATLLKQLGLMPSATDAQPGP